MLSDAGVGGAIKFQPTYPYGVRHRCFGVIRRVLHSWVGRLVKLHFNPRTHKYRYGSTFLHYCGLIGSHVVPIAHSVLSGLDNEPHMKP